MSDDSKEGRMFTAKTVWSIVSTLIVSAIGAACYWGFLIQLKVSNLAKFQERMEAIHPYVHAEGHDEQAVHPPVPELTDQARTD